MTEFSRPTRIVSGGQTGVDRAALDVALELGIEVGGWCPAGRVAEDGRIPDRYPLSEAASALPAVRTRANVRDSDGTLVVVRGTPSGGTLLTIEEAKHIGKPLYVARPGSAGSVEGVREWLARERIGTLNLAGPRESEEPGVYGEAVLLLRAVFGEA